MTGRLASANQHQRAIELVRMIARALRYIWAFPTSALGLGFLIPTLASGGGVQWVDGVMEIYGGLTALFLRHCTLLPGGASAMTLGHVVLGRDQQCLQATRSHERVHVRQTERWGPLFVPAYLLGSVYAALRGRHAYRDNPFEREAYDSGKL